MPTDLQNLPAIAGTAERMYSVEQVAALLGVTRLTVWRWIRGKDLRACRLGRRCLRVPDSALQEFIASHSTNTE